MIIEKAAHDIYENFDCIKWLDLPEPVAKEIKRIIKYTYLEDRLYLFKCNQRGAEVYFMSKGGSPWEALRNYLMKYKEQKER